MRSGASMSSIQNAAIMARVHATASRRAFVTSPSYVDDRSRITFDVASYSSNTAMSCIRKALRDRFGMDAKCARISAPINVNSGDGGGISSLNDGGIEPRSTPRTPTGRAPQRNLMERRKGYSRNRGNRQKIVNGRYIAFTFAAAVRSRDEQPSDTPRAGAVGREASPPARLPAGPFPHGRTADSTPAASLCPVPVVRGAPKQRRRNLVRLSPGLAFAPRSTGKPFLARDYRSPSKAQVDHVAHLSVLLSTPAPEASQP